MKITPDMVPHAVAKAARLSRCDCLDCIAEAKRAVAAALSAWPGAYTVEFNPPLQGDVTLHGGLLLPFAKGGAL